MDFRKWTLMKKNTLIGIVIFIAPLLISAFANRTDEQENIQALRHRYSSGRQAPWPKPHIDPAMSSNTVDNGVLPE